MWSMQDDDNGGVCSLLPNAHCRFFLSWRFLLHSYYHHSCCHCHGHACYHYHGNFSKMMITEDACPWASSETIRHYVCEFPISCNHIRTSKCQAAKARRQGKSLEPQTGSTESTQEILVTGNAPGKTSSKSVENIKPILVTCRPMQISG